MLSSHTRSIRLVGIIVLMLLLPDFVSAQTFFTAKFSTAQENHDVVDADSATGTAAMVLTEEGLRYYITVNNLSGDIAAAHFHNAPAGENGGVVRTLTPDFVGHTANGIWTSGDAEPLTDELIKALYAGSLYINVHTGANGSGEIRAQVRPTSGAALTATITPAQETHEVQEPSTDVAPRGTASVQVTPDGVAFFISVYGMTSVFQAAHFHMGPTGENGPVVRTLTEEFGGGPEFWQGHSALGLWTADDAEALTTEHRAAFMTGNMYINIHTADNAAGHLRGQVLPGAGFGAMALLDTSNETHDVVDADEATGLATLILTDAGLSYHLTANSLSGPIAAAHFHNAPEGENGPVVRTISGEFEGNTASGLWSFNDPEPLTTDLIRELIQGNIYMNIHTGANGAGEIRAQVAGISNTALSAYLTTAQENQDVTTDQATGTAFMELTPEGLNYYIVVDNLTGPITAAHFHQAPSGENGDVVHGITDAFFLPNVAAGTWGPSGDQPLTPELLEALLTGNLYLNVHTTENGGGEIRGQVHVTNGTGFRAQLTMAQENHDVVPGARDYAGTAALTLTPVGLVFNLNLDGLTEPPTAAHFHNAPPGENGGVVRTITDDFLAPPPLNKSAIGLWTPNDAEPFTPEMRNELLAGNLYLNVHTSANGAGELRGQVQLSGGTGIAVGMDPGQEVGAVTGADLASGSASVTLTNAGVVFDLTVADLSGEIAAAHFHNASTGVNGPVVHTITDDFGSPTAFGVWRAVDPEPFTAELMSELLAGNLYFNVHTLANGGGEIRGQLLSPAGTITSVEAIAGSIPETIELAQNYPNPFNPTTTISFALSGSAQATLNVYNMLGQTVATLIQETLAAGRYRVAFDASALPSGVYYYQLEAGGKKLTEKMILLK